MNKKLFYSETGQRGYIITGNADFLKPDNDSSAFVASPSVRNFIANEIKNEDPKIILAVKQLEDIKDTKFNELDRVVKERNFILSQDLHTPN